MDKFENKGSASSESSNIKDSPHNSGTAHFIKSAHSLHIFQIIAGVFQTLLGLCIIAVSVLGLIQPLWLSAALSVIASVSTMIGLYLVYIKVEKLHNHNLLKRNAIRRVMEARN